MIDTFDTIVISGFVGFLLGMTSLIIVMKKSFDEVWESAYKAGEQYGEETERIRQALEKKNEELFAEVSGE